MKHKIIIAVLLASALCLSAKADQMTPSTPSINTTTIDASSQVSPGRYGMTIEPSINTNMADRIKKALGNIPGVGSVTSNVDDSSIHFTVKTRSHVREADLRKAVASADSGAMMSTPILEHSQSANPGL